MIYTDSYYEIGQTHSKCDDYAIAGTDDGLSYAIVSDGCTGSSSKHTDLGSRLLTLIAKDLLIKMSKSGRFFTNEKEYSKDLLVFRELMLNKIIEIRSLMSLSLNTFEATLLSAISTKNGNNVFLAFGDGTFIVKYDNGIVNIITIKFNPNFPYYLIYGINSSTQNLYRDGIGSGTMTIVETTIENGKIDNAKFTTIPYSDSWYFAYNPDTFGSISQIIVCSDGISSFQHDPKSDQFLENSSVFDETAIYNDVTDFKNLNGCFVEKRLRRLSFTNAKKRIIHTDDIGVAAICFEKDRAKYDPA